MKIKIHDSTYIFLLISFLSGYFEYMYILLIIIFIHELGHYTLAKLNKVDIENIIIYPFGGITKLDCDLNISIKKETIILLGGILFQILFFLLIKKLYIVNHTTTHVYNIFKKINYILISFNFLPIIPLDGGKLLNIFLDKFISYKKSNYVTIIISIIFVMIFLLNKRTIFSLILSIFLLKEIYIEQKNIKFKYNKFLLERNINNYNFKRIKIINDINDFKRDNYHIINNEFERNFLSKMFDTHI